MRLRIAPGGRAETPAHPAVDGAGLAVAARATPDGSIAALITFRAPRATVFAYDRPAQAVALLVDVPDRGLTVSDLLVDRDSPCEDAGPNWLGLADGKGVITGWLSATVELDAPLTAPTTLFVRAALRDLVSPAARVDLVPAPAPPPPPPAPADTGEEG